MKCASCEHYFWSNEPVFHSKYGYHCYICQQCAEKEVDMPNIKITAEINGKQVPLENISIETFEAIKALEKPKGIPVARLTRYDNCIDEPRLLFKPTENIQLKVGKVYGLDLRRGMVTGWWELKNDEWAIKNTYPANITIL